MYLGKTDVFTFEMEDIAILRVCLGPALCIFSLLPFSASSVTPRHPGSALDLLCVQTVLGSPTVSRITAPHRALLLPFPLDIILSGQKWSFLQIKMFEDYILSIVEKKKKHLLDGWL